MTPPTTTPQLDSQTRPATDTGYAAGGTAPATTRFERSRPGWVGTAAVAVGAALLASLGTVGAVNAFGMPANAAASPTSQSAPLVKGDATVPNWVATAAAVRPSVVSVRVQAPDGSGGQGSGVILDASGRVLTNNHVVAAASGATISVVLDDGRTYQAKVVGTDPSTDLAVIAIQQAPRDLVAATFADSSQLKVGDPVMAIGNPLGLSSTTTTGVVSALNRPVTTTVESAEGQGQGQAPEQGQEQAPEQGQQPGGPGQAQPQGESVVTDAIQTDAAINPGNSGGALVDSGGRVIGITSSIASLGAPQGGQAGSIGLGFAIPANEAKDVAQQLISTGQVQHAYLGVTLTDGTATADGAQRAAAVIGTVTPGSPAAKAGAQAKDAVIAVDGRPLQGADSLVAQVRALHPGATVDLTVVRGDQQQTLHLTVAARPSTGG
jgi:putative serine protease PepD